MNIRLGVVMDPISSINTKKDSTFAMLLEAQQRGWELYYMEMADLSMIDGQAIARCRQLIVRDQAEDWFDLGDSEQLHLQELNVILMRKDPPFDMQYIYATFILQRAHEAGCLIVNRPDSLRNANEKLFTAWFPECCPPTLVSRDMTQINDFIRQHMDAIVKPLDGMGGSSVFRIRQNDPNTNVILETLTENGLQYCMTQRFIPEITAGDKRILLIDGEPVPYALARIPAKGENRGNLAAGGHGEGVPLSEKDFRICRQVAPALKEMGLLFVGLDVIGDYLTEINVTSPTCIRELDNLFDLNIAGMLMNKIEENLGNL